MPSRKAVGAVSVLVMVAQGTATAVMISLKAQNNPVDSQAAQKVTKLTPYSVAITTKGRHGLIQVAIPIPVRIRTDKTILKPGNREKSERKYNENVKNTGLPSYLSD